MEIPPSAQRSDEWEADELDSEEGDEHVDPAPSRLRRLAARRALTEQAAPESEDGPRERALRALAETAEALLDVSTNGNWNADVLPLYHLEDAGMLDIGSGLLRLFWTENSAVLISGARGRARGAKLEALKALHVLTNDTFMARLLWADEHGARAALLAAAAAGHEDEDVGCLGHATLSLIACTEGCAAQMWQHPPTRQVVLSTLRGSQLALRVRLEAWNTLSNLVEWSSSVPQQLWVGDAAADVRSVVMVSLGDDTEPEVIKMKALAFLALVIKRGGAAAATALWAEELARSTRIEGGSQRASGSTSTRTPPRYTFVLPACADSTEASATRMRHAALRLLCASCAELPRPAAPATEEQHGSDAASEAARTLALSDEVMRVLLAAFEGDRAVLEEEAGRRSARATLREECETEYERLEMSRAARDGSGSGDSACLPLRERARYANLTFDERLARLRRIWERNNRGKGRLGVRVTLGSIMEDLLNLGQKLGDCDHKKLQDAGVTNLRFAFDRGSDAGGLTRHCFSEFGKGLANVESVGATAGALREVKRMLKEWRPSVRSESVEAMALMEKVRAIIQQHDQEAADASGCGHGGGGEGSGGSMGPPASKRPRVSKPPAMLFKLTESGSLAPSGAETLCGRVGEATDEAGAIVPEISDATLRRFCAIGRVCALALVNNATLGLPFARYFLRLVLNEPPKALADLQAEEEAERATNFGLSATVLKSSLADQGMAGMMTFRRQASNCEVPLARMPSLEVTDDNKADFLRRTLEHQLVRTIERQAIAFRAGVEEITGVGWLQLLSAAELKEVWGGHAIDDSCLAKWREHTRCSRAGSEAVANYFWEWLGKCSESKRAQVLQFATGSLRLPGDTELKRGWKFVVESLDHYQEIAPTESNGLSAPAMLARASTCSNTIYLPPYADVDALEHGMGYSLMDGGFGLA